MSVPFSRSAGLRYGENPHQQAAFYTDASLAEAGQGGIATATQHHGKEVGSHPNLLLHSQAGTAATGGLRLHGGKQCLHLSQERCIADC